MSNLYMETQIRQALDAVLPDLIRDLTARLTLDEDTVRAKLTRTQTSNEHAEADRPLTENSRGIFLLPDGSLVQGVLHDIHLDVQGAWITTPAGTDFWVELPEIRDVTDRQVEWSLPGGVTATASAENALAQQDLGAADVFRAR